MRITVSETERIRQQKYQEIAAIGELKAGRSGSGDRSGLVTSRGLEGSFLGTGATGVASRSNQHRTQGEVTG